jgi:hypothetical protein
MSVRALRKKAAPVALRAARMRACCASMAWRPSPPTMRSSKLQPIAPVAASRAVLAATAAGATA